METVVKLFETLYKNDDAGFETLRQIFRLHMLAAEFSDDEKAAEYHLTRAFELAEKSASISKHTLDLPLLQGLEIQDAPEDNIAVVNTMLNELQNSGEFSRFENTDRFCKIIRELNDLKK